MKSYPQKQLKNAVFCFRKPSKSGIIKPRLTRAPLGDWVIVGYKIKQEKMIPYGTKAKKLPGTNLGEIYRSAMAVYHKIEKQTKRRPYLRSAYFKKEKVFFDFFWDHLKQKSPKERFKRLEYFKAACELIKNSRNVPIAKPNPNNLKEIYYRFAGLTAEKELFYVQIKEVKKRGQKPKYFMSCFPPE